MWKTIWHYAPSPRKLLTFDPVSSQLQLCSNLSRGWWVGTMSAGAKRCNMLVPSVVYFPSLHLSACVQPTHLGLTALIPPAFICLFNCVRAYVHVPPASGCQQPFSVVPIRGERMWLYIEEKIKSAPGALS